MAVHEFAGGKFSSNQPRNLGSDRSDPGFHIFIGTKAQYIKTAPLMRLMQAEGVEYHLIDSGQHRDFAATLRAELGIKQPDIRLSSSGDVSTILQAAGWFARHLGKGLLRPERLRRDVFGGRGGICIIHGDTPSTLLALLLSKRAGLRVAHIEAGLRSFKLLRPFPEELVRILCMRFSDYLFAPSDWAYENLRAMGRTDKSFNIQQNTNVEAVQHALERAGSRHENERAYCLFTVHRVETLYNRRRLRWVVWAATRTAQLLHVYFVLHPPTRRRLVRYGLLRRLANEEEITLCDLMPHTMFIGMLSSARFAVTDGGSVQEECSYLNVPCFIVRAETERREGLGQTARIGRFDGEEFERFLQDYQSLRSANTPVNRRPSEQILGFLRQELHSMEKGSQ